jgi:fluoroacetyl-CoA thioesterase
MVPMKDELSVGLQTELEWTAEPSLCITRGPHTVFSTPNMANLLETACEQFMQTFLPAGQSSVGARVDVRHLAPTPQGMKVRAIATVARVDGRRVVFSVDIFDEVEKAGEATHERFIIDLDRFGSRLSEKLDRSGHGVIGTPPSAIPWPDP